MNNTEKTAIDHITDNGMDSRTNKFNAIWIAVTAFVTAYLGIAEDLGKTAMVMIPAGMTLVSSMVNTLLYGSTHVKHAKDRNQKE